MKKSEQKNDEKVKTVRVSKGDKQKQNGATNWAALIAEEKKEGLRK
jgi:hypothetical protein